MSTVVCGCYIISRLKFETADGFHLFSVLCAKVYNETNLILNPGYRFVNFLLLIRRFWFYSRAHHHATELQNIWVFTRE